VGSGKYYGVAISYKDLKVKNLGGIELVDFQNGASKCSALLPAFRKLTIEV
jgi:hypothetical protein